MKEVVDPVSSHDLKCGCGSKGRQLLDIDHGMSSPFSHDIRNLLQWL